MYQARRRSARILDRPTAPGPVRAAPSRVLRVALALAPLVGLAVLVGVLLFGNLVHTVSGGVPVESVAVEDVRLSPGTVELRVRNDGQTEVTLSQVMVDDAFRPFTVSAPTLGRLASSTVVVPYPWQEAIPLRVALLTSTGTVIEHEIPSPSPTPTGAPATFAMLALIGLAMAAIPVALGLLWLPMLRRASARVTAAMLAFTLGLLAFLLVDTTAEGLELAAGVGTGLNGVGVFALGALAALAIFAAVESLGSTPALRSSGSSSRPPSGTAPGSLPGSSSGLAVRLGLRGGRRGTAVPGMRLAWLVAVGIGLHNLGEGLAVGTAMRIGEVALGAALVVGFAIHNLTEGVAIAAPLASSPQPPTYPQLPLKQDQLSPPAGKLDPGWPPGEGGACHPSGGGGAAVGRGSSVRAAGGSWLRGSPAGAPGFGALLLLAAVAGLPAIPGLWLGGLTSGGVWAVLGLGIAAGAIAQVVLSVGRLVVRRPGPLAAASFTAAVGVMYLTGLLA
jgi:zinc transporter ZupT